MFDIGSPVGNFVSAISEGHANDRSGFVTLMSLLTQW